VEIYYKGLNGYYATLLDFSPDRIVKPLVMNEELSLLDGLERQFSGTVGDVLGDEYVMLIISRLPLTDSKVESIALAPNEVELDDNIKSVAVNQFTVPRPWNDPDVIVDWAESTRSDYINSNDIMIPLEDFAIYLDYPLNTWRYNPWRYMYLYPYPRFRPTVYLEDYGILSKRWYVFPQGDAIKSNLWDYAYTGWLDNGLYIIPPGGYYQGKFNVDDPYSDYYLRVLPLLTRSAQTGLRVEINGQLVQSSIDITGAIGWGEFWTSDPFEYYSIRNLLRQGDNELRIYNPEDSIEDVTLQMADILPADEVKEEMNNTDVEGESEQ